MKDIATFIISLFQELKLSTRWLALFSLFVVVLVGVLGYEQITGQFYLSKLERKVALLKELQTIANTNLDDHPELRFIYVQTADELRNFEVRPSPAFTPTTSLSSFIKDPYKVNRFGKAVSGAFLWIIILIFGVSSEYQKNGKLTGMAIGLGVLLLVIAMFFAWVGTRIPTLYNPWVNIILFPIVQFGVIYLFMPKKKKA